MKKAIKIFVITLVIASLSVFTIKLYAQNERDYSNPFAYSYIDVIVYKDKAPLFDIDGGTCAFIYKLFPDKLQNFVYDEWDKFTFCANDYGTYLNIDYDVRDGMVFNIKNYKIIVKNCNPTDVTFILQHLGKD